MARNFWDFFSGRRTSKARINPRRGPRPRKGFRQAWIEYLEDRVLLATDFWTGAGPTANWSNAANWGGSAPFAGDDLVFPDGAAQLYTNNDFTSGTSFNSITFGQFFGTTGGYTIAGNAITVGAGGITSVSAPASGASGTNTISANLTLGSPETIYTDGNANGDGMLIISGSLNLNGNALTITGAGNLLVSGIISGSGGITDNDAQVVTFTGANTFSGATVINDGILNIQSAGALGTTGVDVVSGTTLQIQGALTVTTPILELDGDGSTRPGAVGTGALETFGGNVTIQTGAWTGDDIGATISPDAGTLTISQVLTGQGGTITKAGLGTLTLSGANSSASNVFNVNVNQGILLLSNASAIGPVGPGTVTVSPGASLEISASISAHPLAVSGSGFNPGTGFNNIGAFADVTTAATWPGAVTLNGDTWLGAVTSNVNLTISGAISDAGSSNVTKVGAGGIVLTNADTWGSSTVINAGTLTINGTGGSLFAGGPTYVNQGGTLTLDNSASFATSTSIRLTNNTNVTLNGGTLSFLGFNNASTASSTTIGNITLNSGLSTINVNRGTSGGSSTIFANSLIRNPGAAVNFTTTNAGSVYGTNTFVNLAIQPALSPASTGILPYALVNNSDFATYNGASIVAYANYVPFLAVAGPNDVVKVSGNETLTGNKSVGAILFEANATISEGGYNLNVDSGAIFNAVPGTGTITGGTVNMGSSPTSGVEGIIGSFTGGTTTIQSPISGNAGMTFDGVTTGILNLPQVNTYTGPTALVGGVVNLGAAGSISSGALTLINGTLAGSEGISLANPWTMNFSTITFAGAMPITLTGLGTLGGDNTITVSNTAGTTLSGIISDPATPAVGTNNPIGDMTLTGTGALFLNGVNTFSGGVIINATAVDIGNNRAFGNGASSLYLTSGTLLSSATANLTITNPVFLNGAITFGASSSNNNGLNFSSPATLQANTTVTESGNTTFSNTISGGGTLTVAGIGTLTLSGVNTYTGGTVLNAAAGAALAGIDGISGTLVIGSYSALGTGPLTLTAGTLQAASTFTALVSGVATSGITNNAANPLILSNLVTTGGIVTFGGYLGFAGPVVLSSNSTYIVNNTTVFEGPIFGAFALTTAGSGTLMLTGGALYGGPTAPLAATTVLSGTLELTGSGYMIGNTLATLTIDQGATLLLDDNNGSFTSNNLTSRILTTSAFMPVTLNGGTLQFNGNSGAGSSATLGALTLSSGHSSIVANNPAGAYLLSFASLSTSAGATVEFDSGSAASLSSLATGNQIQFRGTSPTTFAANNTSGAINILPYGTVTNPSGANGGIDIASVVTSGVNFAIVAATNYFAGLSAVGATVNALVKVSGTDLGGSDVLSASLSIGALLLSAGGVVDVGSNTLTLTSGAMASTGAGTSTIKSTSGTGSLALGAASFLAAGAATATIISANISGAFSLTTARSGNVTLSGSNTYSLGTIINGSSSAASNGIVTLTGVNSLGTGGLTLVGGGLKGSSALTLNNAVTLGTTANVAFTGTNPITLVGTVALGSTLDNLNIASGQTLTLDGVVSNAVAGIFAKNGLGTLVLVGANTYTGLTSVSAGILNIQNASALGTIAGGTVMASGSLLQLQGAITTLSEVMAISGTGIAGSGAIENIGSGSTGAVNTLAAPITLYGDTTVSVDAGQLTLSGIISGAAGLTKIGSGILADTNNNSYTGITNVNSGVLSSPNILGLGSLLSGTVVADGASLLSGGGTVVGEQLTLTGSGLGQTFQSFLLPQGALVATSAMNWNGNVILNSGSGTDYATISALGVALTINGIVSGSPGTLVKVGNNVLTLAASNTFTGNVVVAAGTLTITNANTFAGTVTVGTTATLTLNTFGTLLNTTGITASVGSTINIDDNNAGSGVNLPNRINDNATITLNGSALNFTGNIIPGTTSSETLGALLLASGNSTITATTGTGVNDSALLSFMSLTRTAGATVVFVGANANLGTIYNQIDFLTNVTGALVSGILPYGLVNNTTGTAADLATFNQISGTTYAVAAYTNYVTDITQATSTSNVKLAANQVLPAGITVNSLLITSGSTLSLGNSTLTIASGLLASTSGAANTIIGGTLNFGGQEALIAANNLTIQSPIVGSGGLTIFGSGSLYLPVANTLTGTTTVNAGTLQLGNPAAITPTQLVLTAGSLTVASGMTLADNVSFSDSAFTFNQSDGTLTFAGNVTLTDTSTLTQNSTVGGVIFSGLILDGANPGGLILSGAGPITLSGTNFYSGGTVLNGATLSVNSASSIGSSSAPLTFIFGTFYSSATASFSNPIYLDGAVTLTGTSPVTFSNTATLVANTTITVQTTTSSPNTTTFSGNFGENGGARVLTLAGQGTLTLSGTNTFSGGLTLTMAAPAALAGLGGTAAGTLDFTSPAALGYGTLTLTSGNFQAASAQTIINNVVFGSSAIVGLLGPNLTFTSPTVALTNGVTETIYLTNTTTFTGFMGGGFGALTLAGTGTLLLTNAASFSGAVVIAGGTLDLAGFGSLATPTTSSITVDSGGTLMFDDTLANVPLRLAVATPIVLNGGTLSFQGAAGLTSTLTAGALTLASGASTISSTIGTGGKNTITFASLARAATSGATVRFVAGGANLDTATNQIIFAVSPSVLEVGAGGNAIFPFAIAVGTSGSIDLATLSTNNVVAYAAYAAVTDITLAAAGSNVKITSAFTNTSLTASLSLNAVLIVGTGINLGGAANTTLTLTGGALVVNAGASGTATISVPTLAFGSVEGELNDVTGSTTTITSLITGTVAATSDGLTISGGGTLILPTANTFTGVVTVNGGYTAGTGVVTLGTTAAFGPSANNLTLIGGTLQSSAGGLVFNNTLSFDNENLATFTFLGNTVSSVTFGGSSPIVFTGATNLGSGLLDTVTFNTFTTFSGIIGGTANLIKNGLGTVWLSGVNNYTGLTVINAGIVDDQNSTGLGSTTFGTIIASGATLQMQGASSTAEPLAVSGTGATGTTGAIENVPGATAANTLSGVITLYGDTTVSSDTGTLTISGAIAGAGGLNKAGTGILALSGANTYTGLTTVNAGILQANVAAALGSLVSGTTVASGASLELNATAATIYNAEAVALSGTGFGYVNSGGVLPRGALDALASESFTSNITLNGNTAISAVGGTATTLTILGNINDAAGLVPGTGDLTKVGAGTLALEAANTFIGNINVLVGTLTLSATGTLYVNTGGATTGGITLNVGTSLTLDNANAGALAINLLAVNATNRVGDSTAITLKGGTINFLGNNTANAPSLETLGAVSLQDGASTINSTSGLQGGATAALTFSSLTRTAGATVDFVGGGTTLSANEPLGTTSNSINFLTPLTSQLVNGILPWATVVAPAVAAVDFATYGASGVAAYANYKTSLAAAGPNDNVKLLNSETLTGNKTVNSLLIVNGTTVGQAGYTLTVGSGGLLATSGGGTSTSLITGGTLEFGGAEGVISFTNNTAAATSNLTIASAIAGTNGLTLSAPAVNALGTLTLNANSNVYSGATTIDGGIVVANSNGSFSTGPLNLIGGTLTTATAGTVLPNAINFVDSVFTFGGTVALTLAGLVTLTDNNGDINALTFSNTGGVIFGGVLTDGGTAGALALMGASPVTLANNNTYTGGTILGGAVLTVDSPNSIGGSTGFFLPLSGTIQAGDSSVTLANPLTLISTTFTIAGITPITFTGAANVQGINTITVNNSNGTFTNAADNTTFSGLLSGGGSLAVTGAAGSNLVLTNTNTFTGGVLLAVAATTITIASNSALGTGLITSTAGTIQDDGTLRNLNNNIVDTVLTLNTVNQINLNGFVSGPIAATLTKTGSGTLAVTAADSYGAGTGGATTVSAGILTLNVGGELDSTSFTVAAGATLQLDNSTVNNLNRLADTSAVTLNGGTFNFIGNNTISTASAETIGPVTLGAGSSTINSTVGTGTGDSSVVTIASTLVTPPAIFSLARNAGALVNFVGTNAALGGTSATNQIRLNTAATTTTVTGGNILAYATVSGPASAYDFASDIVSNGINTVQAFASYVSGFATATSASVVKTVVSDSVTANETVAGVLVIAGSTVTITTGVTLTISSGGLVGAGTGALITGGTAVAFGAVEGQINTASGAGLTIATPITGSAAAGLTIGGAGTLTLSGSNLYTGATTIASGTVALANATAFNTSAVTVVNATLQAAISNPSLSNAIAVGTNLTINGTNSLSLSGVISGAGNLTISPSNTMTVTLSGLTANTITGIITVNNLGTLSLSKTSTVVAIGANAPLVVNTGGTITETTAFAQLAATNNVFVNGGTFSIAGLAQTIGALTMTTGLSTASAVTTSTLVLTLGGNLFVIANPTSPSATNATITGTVSTGLTLSANKTFVIAHNSALAAGSADLDISESIGGAFGITKYGAGILQFSGAVSNANTGTTTVAEGTLQLNKNVTSALSGPVVIGDFSTGTAGTNAIMKFGATSVATQNPFGNNTTLTVNGFGTFDLSNSTAANTAASPTGVISLFGGQIINTIGSGTLTLQSNVVATSFANTASTNVASAITVATLAMGSGGARTFTINAALAANSTANGQSAVTPATTSAVGLDVQSIVSGAASTLTKFGAGALLLRGSAANTYTGSTTVNEGTLLLGKSSGVAVPGNLVVGDGLGGTDTVGSSTAGGVDIVRLLANNQILNTAAVELNAPGTVSSSALLDLNGFNNTIGFLATNGGNVTIGTGTLTLSGDVTGLAANTPATISSSGAGSLALAGTNRNFNIAAGTTSGGLDLVVNAIVSGNTSSLTKTGTGTMVLNGVNTYGGATNVNAGTLQVNGSTAAGSAVAVNNTGTLSGIGTINGTLNIAAGGTLAPGTATTAGNLTAANAAGVTFNSGANYTANLANRNFNAVTGTNGQNQLYISNLTAPAVNLTGVTLNLSGGSFAIPTPTAISLITSANPNTTPIGNFAGLPSNTNVSVGQLNGPISYPAGGVQILAAASTANVAPVITLPATPQGTPPSTPLVFNAASSNLISIADADNINNLPEQVTLTVTSGTLTLSGTTGLTFNSGTTNNSANIIVTGTLNNINAALNGLTYTPPGANGSATLSIVANDLGNIGSGGAQVANGSLTITIAALDIAPTITGPSGTLSGTKNTTLLLTGANQITVGDTDSGGNAEQVTLVATNGTLTLGSTTGITFTFGANGSANMAFNGTIANLNNALATLSFTPTTGYFGSGASGASVNATINDLGNTGAKGPLTATLAPPIAINVFNTPSPPVNNVPAAQTLPENTTLVLSGSNSNAISVSDPTIGTNPLQVTLSVASGTLSLNGTAGLTFSTGTGTNNATLVFTGTVANINAALNGLRYTPTANYVGGDTLSITSNDQGFGGTGSSQISANSVSLTVQQVDVAPVNTVPGSQIVNKNGQLAFNTANANTISIADADNTTNQPEQITLTVAQGTLTLASVAGLTFNSGTTNASANIIVTGTLTAINAALNGLSYAPVTGFSGADALTLVTNDLGNTGVGGPLTATSTVNIAVTATSSGPINNLPSAQNTAQDTPLVFSTASGNPISISDAGIGTSSMQFTLTMTNGTAVLGSATGLTINGNGTASIVATGTLVNLNSSLNGLTFTPASGFTGTATLTLTSNDLGNGGGSGVLTTTNSLLITVNQVDLAPVNTVPGDQGLTQNSTLIFSTNTGNAISVADADSGGNPEQITLAVTSGTLTLAGTNGLAFDNGTSNSSATITVTGTLTNINAALDGLVYTPFAGFTGSDDLTLVSNDLGNTGVGGPLSTSSTISITVNALNVAPIVIGAYASGTNWGSGFYSNLDANNLGDPNVAGEGFLMFDGANQLTSDLPWTSVDTISIAFSETVNVSQASLTLYDSSDNPTSPTGFSYDATNSIAHWTFASSLAANIWWVGLTASTVTDQSGTELDGDWTTGTSTFTQGSGDGTPGGDFNFLFNVLPGDVNNNGIVSTGDVLQVKTQLNATLGANNYRQDINANGVVTTGDVLQAKTHLNTSLSQFPTPVIPPAAALAASPVPVATLPEALTSVAVSSDASLQSPIVAATPVDVATPVIAAMVDTASIPAASAVVPASDSVLVDSSSPETDVTATAPSASIAAPSFDTTAVSNSSDTSDDSLPLATSTIVVQAGPSASSGPSSDVSLTQSLSVDSSAQSDLPAFAPEAGNAGASTSLAMDAVLTTFANPQGSGEVQGTPVADDGLAAILSGFSATSNPVPTIGSSAQETSAQLLPLLGSFSSAADAAISAAGIGPRSPATPVVDDWDAALSQWLAGDSEVFESIGVDSIVS
jgi:fibronectin-binding autotransporter adhesin